MIEPVEVITCALICYPDRERVWEPLRDYLTNPPIGTWIFQESRKCQPETVRR